MTYRIVRRHFKGLPAVKRTGLTLEEAQEHCCDPETSSSTCVLPRHVEYTELHGPWFDSYEEEQ